MSWAVEVREETQRQGGAGPSAGSFMGVQSSQPPAQFNSVHILKGTECFCPPRTCQGCLWQGFLQQLQTEPHPCLLLVDSINQSKWTVMKLLLAVGNLVTPHGLTTERGKLEQGSMNQVTLFVTMLRNGQK